MRERLESKFTVEGTVDRIYAIIKTPQKDNNVPDRNSTTQLHDRKCRNESQDAQIGDAKGLKEFGHLLPRVQMLRSLDDGLFGRPSWTRRGSSLKQGNGTNT